MQQDMQFFKDRGDRVFDIGYTVLGTPIPAVIVGEGNPKSLIFGAIHAREHVTAQLVADLAKNYSGEAIIFVPMVNIDGVRLSQEGLTEWLPEVNYDYLLRLNGGSGDFGDWKANIRGVDLNVNFDADWGTGAQNITYPAPANYVGEYPESEPETQALLRLAEDFGIENAVAYHAKGEVIYYGFNNGDDDLPRAQEFSRATGYPALRSTGSAGGFKDWFVERGGFGLTIEVGDDALTYNGLYNDYANISAQNGDVPYILTR